MRRGILDLLIIPVPEPAPPHPPIPIPMHIPRRALIRYVTPHMPPPPKAHRARADHQQEPRNKGEPEGRAGVSGLGQAEGGEVRLGAREEDDVEDPGYEGEEGGEGGDEGGDAVRPRQFSFSWPRKSKGNVQRNSNMLRERQQPRNTHHRTRKRMERQSPRQIRPNRLLTPNKVEEVDRVPTPSVHAVELGRAVDLVAVSPVHPSVTRMAR